MRRLTTIIILLAMSAGVAMATAHRDIIPFDAKRMMDQNGKAFLLDVRTPEEYRQGHLKGAVLIPLNQIERRLAEVPKNRPVIVYCAVGSRSSLVAGFLTHKGYRDVYNMIGGIMGWYRNGYPIER